MPQPPEPLSSRVDEGADSVLVRFSGAGLALTADGARAPAADPGRPPAAILVVDDDDCVRHLLQRALRRHGFGAVLAASGGEALEHCRRGPGQFAAALLDVNMPGLSGPQTLAALRAVAPGLPCCFITGDPRPYTEEGLLALGGARVFWKPFEVAEVVGVLRGLTASPAPAG